MARRRFPSLIVRTIAAALIAVLATGGSWAPAAGPLQCDACRRDLTGNVVCTKRQQVATPAATHQCCKSGRVATAPLDAGAKGAGHDRSGPSPAKCPPCCVPQAHAPAPAVAVVMYSSATRSFDAAPEIGATTTSRGVHESIFHPPRA
jgi:hypothetical protein